MIIKKQKPLSDLYENRRNLILECRTLERVKNPTPKEKGRYLSVNSQIKAIEKVIGKRQNETVKA